MLCGDRFPSLVVIGCHFIDAMGDGENNMQFICFIHFSFFSFLAEKLSMPINSAAVLQLTGRGGGGRMTVGVPRSPKFFKKGAR